MGGVPSLRPPLAPQDPLVALVPGEVPERKRHCSNCEAKLGREAGFCPKCGQEYSFKPSLNPGDLVAGKYEIKGTMAFGGLGWIYLALDTVLSRWVVLKGLLNSKDPNMVAVAVKEREYLAAVKHPRVVSIYDFIAHGREGFIVMEYVNGKTLMSLRKEKGGPLPVQEAISYILELLPAFAYLDEMGLVYCDFKPENAMVEGETVKLIDMGAVRREDDPDGDVYGSKGYAAPEASDHPTALSDLYTVARALAVLVADFDFQGKYERTLPPRAEVPAFAAHESLYRFLQKATRAKVEERFQTAEEMGEQLVGVLREVATGGADLGPSESVLFDHAERSVDSASLTRSSQQAHRGIPALKVDGADAGANIVLAAAAVQDPAKRRELYLRARKSFPASMELRLRSIDGLVEQGELAAAEKELAELGQAPSTTDWRIAWYRARLLLASGKLPDSIARFEAILDDLPGELGPKQALARACELSGDLDRAVRYYDTVSRADPSFTAAAFGLARCLERKGDRPGAAAALDRVTAASSRYTAAQLEKARVLTSDPARLDMVQLGQASTALEGIKGAIEGLEVHRVGADVLRSAAELLERKAAPADASARILGVPLLATSLRLAAEGELRACARFAPSEAEKVQLIDEANRVRPMTFL